MYDIPVVIVEEDDDDDDEDDDDSRSTLHPHRFKTHSLSDSETQSDETTFDF